MSEGVALGMHVQALKAQHGFTLATPTCPACGTDLFRLLDPVDRQVYVEGRGSGIKSAGYRMLGRARTMGLVQKTPSTPRARREQPGGWQKALKSLGEDAAGVFLQRCLRCGSVTAEWRDPKAGRRYVGRGANVQEAVSEIDCDREVDDLGPSETSPAVLPVVPTHTQTHPTTRTRGTMRRSIFTSESVTEGHPDKVCDLIADSILDAHLAKDPNSRVACEVLAKSGHLVIAGEISSRAEVDIDAVARKVIADIGYTDPTEPFHAAGVRISKYLTHQSPEIADGVRQATDRAAGEGDDQGAGDQGIMFGFATSETPELMPLPILLAHRVASHLAQARHEQEVPWLRPDAKTQVSVLYEGNRPVEVTDVVVSTQHAEDITHGEIDSFVAKRLLPRALGDWHHDGIRLYVNPSGSFTKGGPSVDAGVTGRKIIVDSYGGFARHGGGAFSGKDPSKVDRSGAYFCRFVARRIVAAGLASKAEVQVSYAIGRARPVSILVETFGTGDAAKAEAFVLEQFDFRPRAIIERLDLLRPIYAKTTNYGHFGRAGLPWEQSV